MTLAAHRRIRRKQRGTLNIGFERSKRRLHDFAAQACIQILRQARIAAGMGNANSFDDAVRAHLLGDRIHRAYDRHRQPRFLKFLANHSAAATTSPSRGHKEHPFNAVLFQVGRNFLTDSAHDSRRSLIAGNHIVRRVKFARANHPFGLQGA
jgi:hypothetical protein